MSAGYAPVSIGTDSDGSLIFPAGRAALYTIKPTVGLVPQDGLVPVSHVLDSAGPMAKTAYDLAVVLDAIVLREDRAHTAASSYTGSLSRSWDDISVAVLDPSAWLFPASRMRPVSEDTAQMVRDSRLHNRDARGRVG